ncbi:ThiF family adenylyltransferase [Cellulomonas hominis]|uniref:ThiF family adenylyltransferase n=1 Tax=Cellulomonas hominis TaxID=156981 RepID=UPI001B99BE5F|nr:ThiF family adenylyltransferase [Cellulomonas hominis]VTR76514.1 hypothetical protein CHMI_01274 [Cellulomonas hominis]
MQLKRGLRVLRRAADEVQVGTDPRWAVRIRGLTPDQAERLLGTGDRALDASLPRPVLDGLAAAGLVRSPRARPPRVAGRLAPELLGADLTSGEGDGVEALRRRAGATVAITGLDRVGVAVATTLVASGVGTLQLDDPGDVRPGDVGGGVTADHVGLRRDQVVTDLVRALAPSVRVRRPGQASPDVVVTVAAGATDPGTALELLGADVAHLPVVVREADAAVGPFVVPVALAPAGRPLPCVRCVDLHRAALDPAWPVLLAQLTARDRPGRPAVVGASAVLAAVAGGLAAAEVLAHLDGHAPRTLGAQYEIPLPEAEPRLRRWAAHPDCGCAALAT